MMKKLVVDQDKCIGCGTCVAICPEVFELSEEGKAQIKFKVKSDPFGKAQGHPERSRMDDPFGKAQAFGSEAAQARRGHPERSRMDEKFKVQIQEAIEGCPVEAIK